MLSALEIRNFRKFERYTVEFAQRNLLVGPNNAGKSTLIEALRLISIVVNRFGSLNFDTPPSWVPESHASRGVFPSLRNLDFDLGKETFHQYSDPPAVITARFDNGNSTTVYIGPDLEVFSVIRDAEGIAITTKRDARLFNQPRIGIQPQVGPLARRERPLADRYVRGALDSTLAPTHFRNQLRLLAPYFERFKHAAEATWPGLRIDGVELLGVGDDCHLELFVRDGSFVGEVAAMGHGLQMWLQLMWFLARSEQDGTVVLDEPDVYMHPDLQRRLIRFLLARDQQVVIATHSIEMMAEVEPAELVPIDSTHRRTRRAQDVADVQKIVDQVGGVHNIEFARLARASRYVAIDTSDLRLLKRWDDKLDQAAGDALDLLPTFPLNSWHDWPYAVAMKRSIETAGGEPVAAMCFLAPDLRSSAEIELRRQEAATNGIDLHVWGRRSLSNFLLHPGVIARVLRNQSGGSEPSDAAIADELEVIMESLATQVIADAPASASREVAARWGRLEGRLALVPARLVLLRLAASTKHGYGCSAGVADIARGFGAADIDREVAAAIAALRAATAVAQVRDLPVEPITWPTDGRDGSKSGSSRDATATAQVDEILDLLAAAGVID
jgi:predicted ATPase